MVNSDTINILNTIKSLESSSEILKEIINKLLSSIGII